MLIFLIHSYHTFRTIQSFWRPEIEPGSFIISIHFSFGLFCFVVAFDLAQLFVYRENAWKNGLLLIMSTLFFLLQIWCFSTCSWACTCACKNTWTLKIQIFPIVVEIFIFNRRWCSWIGKFTKFLHYKRVKDCKSSLFLSVTLTKSAFFHSSKHTNSGFEIPSELKQTVR